MIDVHHKEVSVRRRRWREAYGDSPDLYYAGADVPFSAGAFGPNRNAWSTRRARTAIKAKGSEWI